MPLQDDPRWCPVKSFQVYLSLLHPEIDALWRQPQCTSYRDEKSPHYGPAKVGHNPLDTFVRRMSQLCNIELHYTNHCLRATRVTILKRANYSDKQIMSITGHQSHSSLNICNHVSGNEKMMMGYTIGYSLPNPSVIPMVQAENASIAPVEARRAMPQAQSISLPDDPEDPIPSKMNRKIKPNHHRVISDMSNVSRVQHHHQWTHPSQIL